MNKYEPVIRSVSVCGSHIDWLPVVITSLRSHGFYNIKNDLSSFRVVASYNGGSASVLLSPSADGYRTFVSVSIVPALSGGVSCGS